MAKKVLSFPKTFETVRLSQCEYTVARTYPIGSRVAFAEYGWIYLPNGKRYRWEKASGENVNWDLWGLSLSENMPWVSGASIAEQFPDAGSTITLYVNQNQE